MCTFHTCSFVDDVITEAKGMKGDGVRVEELLLAAICEVGGLVSFPFFLRFPSCVNK